MDVVASHGIQIRRRGTSTVPRLTQAMAIVAATVLILLAVLANGRPTVFTDTDDYYAIGKELAIATGITEPPELSDEDVAQAAADAHLGRTQLASRSAIYAVFLFALDRLGTLWLVAAVQAAAGAWLLMLVWRTAVPPFRPRAYLVAVGGVTLVSPLPFFAGFAMPDVFAGIASLAAALLLIFPDRLTRAERWLVGAALVFALAVHTSHILFMVPLLFVAGLTLLWLRVGRRAFAVRLGMIALALAGALVANSLYGISVRLRTGEPLRNQPFLTARIIADGPGRAYLRHACATGERYAMCAYRNTELDDSEEILWGDLPRSGVFLLADYATRIAIEDEEPRFVARTIAFAPFAQAAASARNWGLQLAEIWVNDPVRDPVYYLTDPYWSATNLPDLIKRVAHCGPRGDGCPSRLTPEISRWWHGGWLVASVAMVGVALFRRRRPVDATDRRLIAVVMLFLAAIVLNAAVCGILSGPFARYQSRIVWLVPVAAALLLSTRRGGVGLRRA